MAVGVDLHRILADAGDLDICRRNAHIGIGDIDLVFEEILGEFVFVGNQVDGFE